MALKGAEPPRTDITGETGRAVAVPGGGASVGGVSDRRSTASRASRKLLIACVSVLSLAVCSGLAWWQWDRFTSAGGSYQNLGYVLQWPLFGLFPAFMFWRMAKLRRQARANAADGTDTVDAVSSGEAAAITNEGSAGPRPWTRIARTPVVPRAADSEDTRGGDAEDPEDAALAEYNAYLAQLNAREQERN